MADPRGLTAASTIARRTLLGLAGIGTLAAVPGCSAGRGADGRAAGRTIATAEESGGAALVAPAVRAVPLAVEGTRVVPVTGLAIALMAGARALAPESLGPGRAEVTYAWSQDPSWGYLVIEGPAAFDAAVDDAAQAAAHTAGQALVADRVAASEAAKGDWKGFETCCQIAWNQFAAPPGWEDETSVDALELFLVDGQSRSYTLTAYVPHGDLAEANPAFTSLCSAAPA